MVSHNEQVKPASFDVAAPASNQANVANDTATQSQRPSWVIPALLGLAFVAALVVFWLPGRVGPAAPPAPDRSQAQAQPKVVQKSTDAPGAEASPWSDAQLAKLRKDAQDVLANLLEVQESLEQAGVELWAAESFARAQTAAKKGDDLYRERQFVEAKAQYTEGLLAMQEILERAPDVLAETLEEARTAIERGDSTGAFGALSIAAAIQPGGDQLRALTARAESLEQLVPLLEDAQAAEAAGDLALAETLLLQASALDKEHLGVQSELLRVSAAHTNMRFTDAMSRGYLALDENRFDSARAAFDKAASLIPGSSEAASALQEVGVAKTANRLSELRELGRSAQEREQWQQAVEIYEEAIGIDPNIVYAREGLQHARTRAKLDRQFTTTIKEPERLADATVAEATASLLQQAANISPHGPILSRQISELQVLLQRANTSRALTLHSDGETDVIVYKVARMGQFQQRTLDLRPGAYTAVGTRNGYRDVRVKFQLSHDGPLPTVTIRCTEQI